MAVTSRGRLVTRRRFLSTATSLVAVQALGGIAKPHVSRASDRPLITHGLQSGDVGNDSGIVWARADRPARMSVEIATSNSFADARIASIVDALPETDFTAKVLLEDLVPGQQVFYRVRFQDLSFPTVFSEPQTGSFRTAPRDRRTIRFAWSGDTAGQGWGIDESRGGMRTYATMQANRPDFFIHSGDSIYADCPIPAQKALADGQIWRNVVTEEKAKVAETIAEFRGNYKYNLLDRNVQAFNAEVPQLVQWDDHEVTDNWWPGAMLKGAYNDTSALLLAARGRRAFHEFTPTRFTPAEAGRVYRKISYGPLLDVFMLDMRSYRGPNTRSASDDYVPANYLIGPDQMNWLKRALANSRAVWKVIAADMPIGLISDDAVALGDGDPQGREIEIADLLRFMRDAGIRNTVWLTADMHYTAAHRYDPSAAVFQDFDPFWEFVSGPLHAGTWGPAQLDNTFGPKAVFQKGCTEAQGDNLAPCFGLQFFGYVTIDGASGVMNVALKDVNDQELWSIDLEPVPSGLSSVRPS
jgi:alkaline phosphatase D